MSANDYKLMKESEAKLNSQLENSIFKLTTKDNSSDTYYIPVYPRAYIEEVVTIDTERRTVTAKFIIMLTISLKDFQTSKDALSMQLQSDIPMKSSTEKQNEAILTREKQIKQFIKEHLIIEFGYNQLIYIPEHITLENSPYLINKVINNHSDDQYVTYRIKGQIECNAYFDLMFFPYRKIEVQNNLCIRSQALTCKDGHQVTIKYNMMRLMEQDYYKYKQFVPYSLREKFGPYQLQWQEQTVVTSQKQLNTIVNHKPDVVKTIKNIFRLAQVPQQKKQQVSLKQLGSDILILGQNDVEMKRDNAEEMKRNNAEKMKRNNSVEMKQSNAVEVKQNLEGWHEELHPYKHISFKFKMTSIKIPFLLQQEISIWVILIITLFLFHSEPNIGAKYSCIILLLISYTAIITDFRYNHPSEPILTFFQVKLMLLLAVPILLIVSTKHDYYHQDEFKARTSQSQNPYFIVSLAISIFCFLFTIISLIVLSLIEAFRNARRRKCKTNKGEEEMIDWMNMIQLRWGNPDLKEKILSIYSNNMSGLLFLRPEFERNMYDNIMHASTSHFLMNPKVHMIRERPQPEQTQIFS